MSQSPSTESTPPTSAPVDSETLPDLKSERQDSYVKLAMRNMVRKRWQSLTHFALTTAGLLGILIGLAYLTR